MKKSFEIDFNALRGPLLLVLGLLLMALIFIGASLQFRNAMNDERRMQEGKFQALVQDYQELVQAEHIIETLYDRYQVLEKQGFIGEEPRLQWLETLRRTGDGSGIISMQYRLHEQRPYDGMRAINSGSYQVYVSPMDLQVDALHEGDLLVFLDRLYSVDHIMAAVDGCTLQRQGVDEILPGVANLRADCKLSWFTIRTRTDDDFDEDSM